MVHLKLGGLTCVRDQTLFSTITLKKKILSTRTVQLIWAVKERRDNEEEEECQREKKNNEVIKGGDQRNRKRFDGDKSLLLAVTVFTCAMCKK